MNNSSKAVSTLVSVVETIVFLVLTLAIYTAYYYGLQHFMLGHFNMWAAVAVLFFTYMFRLDFLAAIVGFYGAWKVWGWPLPGAVILSVVFMVMSYSINHGIKSRMRRRYFRRKWSDEDLNPVITQEEKPEDQK